MRPRPTGGRPSHNYAKAFKVKLDLDAAQAILRETTERNRPYQPYLEGLVEIGLRHHHELPAALTEEPPSIEGDGLMLVSPPSTGRPVGIEGTRPFKLRLRQEPTQAVLAATELRGRPYQPYLAALVTIGLRHRDELPADLAPTALIPMEAVLLGKTG